MSVIVVDSCVVAKWILPETDSDKAHRLASVAAKRGDRLVVLDLAFPEVANVIWKRYRQKALRLDEVHDCLADLLRSPGQVEPAIPLLGSAVEIAAKHDRSIYDALFVALCNALSADGITADAPPMHRFAER